MYEECLIHLRRLLQMLEEEYTDIAHSLQGELLDACAKVRGTAGCKKKLLETIRGDAERLSAKWDIDIAVAGSYQDAACLLYTSDAADD